MTEPDNESAVNASATACLMATSGHNRIQRAGTINRPPRGSSRL
jgi:hypothetical protein